MTEAKVALIELIEPSGATGLVRELRSFAAERLMEAEVEGLTGAAKGERTAARLNVRNGDRERAWDTRLGRVDLRSPKLRPRRSADRRP